MNLIKLEAVRHHTRRELTPAEARRLVVSANLSVLKAQAAALSLHSWCRRSGSSSKPVSS